MKDWTSLFINEMWLISIFSKKCAKSTNRNYWNELMDFKGLVLTQRVKTIHVKLIHFYFFAYNNNLLMWMDFSRLNSRSRIELFFWIVSPSQSIHAVCNIQLQFDLKQEQSLFDCFFATCNNDSFLWVVFDSSRLWTCFGRSPKRYLSIEISWQNYCLLSKQALYQSSTN